MSLFQFHKQSVCVGGVEAEELGFWLNAREPQWALNDDRVLPAGWFPVWADNGCAGLVLTCILAPPSCATILLLTHTSSTACCLTGGSHIVDVYWPPETNTFSHVNLYDSTSHHMNWLHRLHLGRLIIYHSKRFAERSLFPMAWQTVMIVTQIQWTSTSLITVVGVLGWIGSDSKRYTLQSVLGIVGHVVIIILDIAIHWRDTVYWLECITLHTTDSCPLQTELQIKHNWFLCRVIDCLMD